jgi:hypothetical protein
MKKTVGAILLTMFFFGCSEPLTTREKGAAIGTLGGAGLGAIIGGATGNAGAGAGIGAAVGLLGGAVIGDAGASSAETGRRSATADSGAAS